LSGFDAAVQSLVSCILMWLGDERCRLWRTLRVRKRRVSQIEATAIEAFRLGV
jgi:hypothetical protein